MLLLCLFFLSCGKTNVGAIPNVPFSFNITLSDPRYNRLLVAGTTPVFIDGKGVCGVILYNSPTRGYIAFDRCSSYMPENKCAVILDNSAFTVTDPCSSSKFSLDDGSPQKAPATRYLRQYSVNVYNNQLIVTN